MLSVVVPVYNEAENIEAFIRNVEQSIEDPKEVLLIYDRVEDTTIPAVHALKEKEPDRFRDVSLVENDIFPSASGALRKGFSVARGKAVLVCMADLSDDLSQVSLMQSYLAKGYHVVCPSRYCQGGSHELKSLKAVIPQVAGRALRWLCNFPIHDATNSYRLYSKEVLNAFPIKSTHSFSVTLEIAVKANALGFKFKEIPTTWRNRLKGKSKFPFLGSLVSYLPWFFLAISRVYCLNRVRSKRVLANYER